MRGLNTNILWSKRRFGQEIDMKKQNSGVVDVTLTIDDHTTIIIGEVEYSGMVTVDEATAQTLKSIGKVKDDGDSKDS